ncbi:MAG TPA: rhodanese-like domain-containing protein [Steroidobacteraceae bacterium]|nr:rhodanese-like domain-containing protein [Steroidobacteraceae bacterium]
MVQEISPAEFVRDRASNARTLLLDVREAWELKIASLPGAVHMPMTEIPGRLADLDRDRDIVVMCRSGGRSLSVARFLEAQGYPSVANLTGGILAWSRDIDPTLATY